LLASTSRLLFFFHLPPPHRDLHSFPTRRSSDLRPLPRAPGLRPRRGDPCSRRRGAGDLRPTAVLVGARELLHPGRGRRARAARVDRKSTRLNSSHRTISYAVFCLKKKKDLPILP